MQPIPDFEYIIHVPAHALVATNPGNLEYYFLLHAQGINGEKRVCSRCLSPHKACHYQNHAGTCFSTWASHRNIGQHPPRSIMTASLIRCDPPQIYNSS